jgi:hypothetical protein
MDDKKKKLETLPEPPKAHKYTQKPRPHTSTNKETTGTTVFERFYGAAIVTMHGSSTYGRRVPASLSNTHSKR